MIDSMPRSKNPKALPRAQRGTVDAQTLVYLDSKLLEAVKSAAAHAGVTQSEWWRQAAQEKLNRDKP